MKNDLANKEAGLEDILDAESEGTGGGRKEERTEDRLIFKRIKSTECMI